jgi:glycosyltransferase involved in cell wall biosynthesis
MSRREKKFSLFYLAPGDVLKGRVEPIIWTRTCEWFARLGHRVSLIAPYFYRRENIRKKDYFRHFGVDPVFELRILPTPVSNLLSGLTWVRFWYFFWFLLALTPLAFRKGRVLFYSKGNICMQAVLVLEKIARRRFLKVFELHAVSGDRGLLRMLRRMDLVVVNSRAVRKRLVDSGVDVSRIIQLYNGPFTQGETVDKISARKRLGLFPRGYVVSYAGKLYGEIVRFIIDSAVLLKDEMFEIHVFGGNPEILRFAEDLRSSRKADNVTFHGFLPPSEISLHLCAADFLFCSYSNSQPNIDQATPAKYFDYMYVGRPIFCSDNTAIKEIFSDAVNCVFFQPQDSRDFVSKLLLYAGRDDVLEKMVERNLELIGKFNWKKRTQSILARLSGL